MEAPARLTQLCSRCEHGALSQSGVFCLFYKDEVLDERIAAECQEWDNAYPDDDTVAEPAPAPGAVIHRAVIPLRKKGSSTEDLTEAAMTYLASLHTSGWGQSWSVTTTKDRRGAAEWLVKTIEAVLSIKEGADA